MSSTDTNQYEDLKNRLRSLSQDSRLAEYQQIIEQLAQQLALPAQTIAATLLMDRSPPTPPVNQRPALPATNPKQTIRSVRYRLDVGRQHQINEDSLLSLIIEESGVDRKRITYLEIREHYTLIDLPEGMPADIFQLLSEAQIGPHPLNIKRLKPGRRRSRMPQKRS